MTSTTSAKPRLTSLAPQFLVDDLERTIAYYRDVLGFAFGEPWNGFYAIGHRDGLELHFKQAPKNQAERQIGAITSTWMPRRAWKVLKPSTRPASPLAPRSSSR
jgi:catechol-2,3-dioxygenase